MVSLCFIRVYLCSKLEQVFKYKVNQPFKNQSTNYNFILKVTSNNGKHLYRAFSYVNANIVSSLCFIPFDEITTLVDKIGTRKSFLTRYSKINGTSKANTERDVTTAYLPASKIKYNIPFRSIKLN